MSRTDETLLAAYQAHRQALAVLAEETERKLRDARAIYDRAVATIEFEREQTMCRIDTEYSENCIDAIIND